MPVSGNNQFKDHRAFPIKCNKCKLDVVLYKNKNGATVFFEAPKRRKSEVTHHCKEVLKDLKKYYDAGKSDKEAMEMLEKKWISKDKLCRLYARHYINDIYFAIPLNF